MATETVEAPKQRKTRKPAKMFTLTALSKTATERLMGARAVLSELAQASAHFPRAGKIANDLNDFMKNPTAKEPGDAKANA